MKKFILIIKINMFTCLLITVNQFLAIDTKINELQNKIDQFSTQFDATTIHDIENTQRMIEFFYEFDQAVREEYIHNFDTPEVKTLVEKMDKEITKWVKKIIEIHGWTSISKFGEKTDHQMWLLVQHADHDPMFQAAVAFLLEELAQHKETNIKNFAYLFDRVALNFQTLGLKQRYGTQVSIKNNTVELFPYYGTPEELNKRRIDIGLEPIAEYLKRFSVYIK